MISKVVKRKDNRQRRKLRIRRKVFGTTITPRLSVFRSNRYIYGQLIDDTKGTVLVSLGPEVKSLHKGVKKVEGAKKCGVELANLAIKSKIKRIVFDRNGYKYTGRVAEFAKGAREGGLEF